MLQLDIKLKNLNHHLYWQCLLRRAKHRIVIVTSESISILRFNLAYRSLLLFSKHGT